MKKQKKKAQEMMQFPPAAIPLDLIDPIVSDPLGSYTGVPQDILDKPVQDADDL